MKKEISDLKPGKSQDIYHVNFDSIHDYKKVKYIMSRLNVNWAPNDFTKTLYFLGKKRS